MSDDAPPIDPDEPLLRRIFIGQGHFDPEKSPSVQAGAFTPNPTDTDGISIYRERLSSASVVVNDTDRPTQYKIARILARDYLALGLTLEPKEEPGDLPGHLVVPEINIVDYQGPDKDKIRKIKELRRLLTNLANEPGATFQPNLDKPPTQ